MTMACVGGHCVLGYRVLGHQLYLDPDDFADHEISDRLQYDAGDQQGMADGIGEQRTNETGIEHEHDGNYDGWHAHQQRHGKTAMGRGHPYLGLNFETLADDIGQIVKNLGEVAASLALQHNRGDEKLYVDQGHALGEIDERIANRHAEL